MKTYLTYGFVMAIAGALLTLALYFLGYHSDVEKLSSAQMIGSIGGLIIGVAVIILGIKARRAEIPESEPFGYGSALWAGVAISFFGSLFGIITNLVYFKLINPGMMDLIVQTQLDKMEAKGMSGAQLEQAEKMVRMMTGPVISSAFGFIAGFIFGTIIALIVAAFLRRKPAAETVVAA
jgi:hypothetical protein